MRNIAVVLFAVLFIYVQCKVCDNLECLDRQGDKEVPQPELTNNLEIRLELPKFKLMKNIALEDLNTVLQNFTAWFGNKLNSTKFVFNQINNKTKINIKTFNLKVDFEEGDAKIDVGLTDGDMNNSEYIVKYDDNSREIDKSAAAIYEAVKDNIASIINKQALTENEIYKTLDFDTTYYDDTGDNSTDYPEIDYIDLYKDTTNEEYLYTGTELPTTLPDFVESRSSAEHVPGNVTQPWPVCNGNTTCESFTRTVFPWVVTIFIKNDTENSQFHYFCDGALLSDTVVLTGGRCMFLANISVTPENVLVFLGKGNLQSMEGTEKLHRIKEIIIHPNFTMSEEDKASNDLALLILDEPAMFADNIQGACIHYNETDELEASATTAWGPHGQLLPIFFDQPKSDLCYDKNEYIICASYSLKVALCPSYGGLFATKRRNRWCLQGVFYGNPADRGLCFNRNVLFTSLNSYINWIDDTIVNKYIL